MKYIDNIILMDKISSIEATASEKYGHPISNISHWDSSGEFKRAMAQVLQLPSHALPWDYCYTYSLSPQDRKSVLLNLGVPLSSLRHTIGLILQSSTISIINIVNLLIRNGKKRLCILNPSYFSLLPCCTSLGMSYGFEQIIFSDKIPVLPMEKILKGGYDCVWITSPIYGTSCYFNSLQLERISEIRHAGLSIIFDESLALPGRELVRRFPIDRETFFIYSPHKAISINGIKFSIIVSDIYHEEFLEQWVDVLSGALSVSNQDAVFHYISSNFHSCLTRYLEYIKETELAVRTIISEFEFAFIPSGSEGHYVSIFTDNCVPMHKLLDFMQDAVNFCQVSFFPGTLEGFYLPDSKLCFRINLAGSHLELPGNVGRLLTYLRTHYRRL